MKYCGRWCVNENRLPAICDQSDVNTDLYKTYGRTNFILPGMIIKYLLKKNPFIQIRGLIAVDMLLNSSLESSFL